MTKKKTTKPRKSTAPTLLGPLAPAPKGMHCVWFDLGDDGRPDYESIMREPVACLVSYKYKGEVRVGAMVFGSGGLYLAEIEDDNYRGYTLVRENQHSSNAASDFAAQWERDVFDEDEDDEDDEDDLDEEEDDEEDDEDEDEDE